MHHVFLCELIAATPRRGSPLPCCSSDPSPAADAEKAQAQERQRAEKDAKERERARVRRENSFVQEGAQARKLQWEKLSQARSVWQCGGCRSWVMPVPWQTADGILLYEDSPVQGYS